ncbi:energy transducer TonB [Rhodoferax saidenbachensis]|nr:energy transducer TonB [Rhodoferax saidenbachensis]
MATLSSPAAAPSRTVPAMSRNTTIAVSVVLLHIGALWALQSGLLRRVVEIVVPAEILVEMMAPPAAEAPPAVVQPKPAPKPLPTQQPTPKAPAPQAAPLPTPMALPETAAAPAPSAIAPASVAPAAASANANASAGTAPSANAQPIAKLELPSSDADYLNNPKPPYPPLSKRLGEQGKVVVRTLIGADGIAKEASIKQSSGFDRLDQAALATALKWRYVPGKRAGVPEAMWFNVPFTFVLE